MQSHTLLMRSAETYIEQNCNREGNKSKHIGQINKASGNFFIKLSPGIANGQKFFKSLKSVSITKIK